MTEIDKIPSDQPFLEHKGVAREYTGGMVVVRNIDQGVIIEGFGRNFLMDTGVDGVVVGFGQLGGSEEDCKFQDLLWNNIFGDQNSDGTIVVAKEDSGYRNRAKFILKFPRELVIDRDEIYLSKQRKTS